MVRHQAHRAQSAINEYLHTYRSLIVERPRPGSKAPNVIPKQHFLEDHCVNFMRENGFALGFHGEQGVENMHQVVNRLKTRTTCLRAVPKRLHFIMAQQWLAASPKHRRSLMNLRKPKTQ